MESRTWAIDSAIFNDLEQPLTQFSRSRHYLTLNISETIRDTDMVTTKLRPSQERHFERSSLYDLAKYSMTRSIARSLCDS